MTTDPTARGAPERIWIMPARDQWERGTGEWMAEFWGLPTETPYILATEAALLASPEVAKLILEAEARGMERAANMVTLAPLAHMPHSPGAVAFFADPTATLNNLAVAIRAEAAALRKGE